MSKKHTYLSITTGDSIVRRWRLVWLPRGHLELQGAPGRAEAPWKKGKRIFLQMGQSPEDLFDAIVHEAGHAAGWNLSEEWIHAFSNDITTIMKRLGFEFKAIR